MKRSLLFLTTLTIVFAAGCTITSKEPRDELVARNAALSAELVSTENDKELLKYLSIAIQKALTDRRETLTEARQYQPQAQQWLQQAPQQPVYMQAPQQQSQPQVIYMPQPQVQQQRPQVIYIQPQQPMSSQPVPEAYPFPFGTGCGCPQQPSAAGNLVCPQQCQIQQQPLPPVYKDQ